MRMTLGGIGAIVPPDDVGATVPLRERETIHTVRTRLRWKRRASVRHPENGACRSAADRSAYATGSCISVRDRIPFSLRDRIPARRGGGARRNRAVRPCMGSYIQEAIRQCEFYH